MAMIKEIFWFMFVMSIGAGLMYHIGPEQIEMVYIQIEGCYAF